MRQIAEWAAGDGHRRSRRDRRPAGRPAALVRAHGHQRTVPRPRVPALRRLLRHADARPRRRGRDRDRQPSPALRGRVGAPGRVRRGDSRMRPRRHRRSAPARGHRHAVLRRVAEPVRVDEFAARRVDGARDDSRRGREARRARGRRPWRRARDVQQTARRLFDTARLEIAPAGVGRSGRRSRRTWRRDCRAPASTRAMRWSGWRGCSRARSTAEARGHVVR